MCVKDLERGKYRTKTDILILKFTRTNHYSMKCILMYKTYKKRALFVIRIIYFKPFQNNYLRTKAFVWERGMHRVLVKTKISKGFINLILNFLYVGNISFKIFFLLIFRRTTKCSYKMYFGSCNNKKILNIRYYLDYLFDIA